jgi:hypothetical protein
MLFSVYKDFFPGLEAVGYDYKVEEDKGEALMLQMEGALQPGYMDKSQVAI